MRLLSDTLARLKRLPRGLPQSAPTSTRLEPFDNFGANPGQLNAWLYVPENVAAGAPLVVVLHGCTQNAAGYDESSGWSRLADQNGFVVLYPEQRRSNNPNLCFNWFSAKDAARGKGEALSIREMVAAVEASRETDPGRVYVTGLSAGGAMAAAMLATYPEVFAGGAVIAGLPFGTAQSIPEAFDRMRGWEGSLPSALSDLVRAASSHSGDWPILSIWHGSADQTVDQSNASALVEQWRALHDTPEAPGKTELVHGYPHRVWRDPSGRDVVEEYSITGLAHGTPLDTRGSLHGEKAAPFMLEAGISSTRLIGRFWGIAPDQDLPSIAPARPDKAAEQRPQPAQPAQAAQASAWSGQAGIGKTIEDALRSAGLMK
ncbi:MAG TPA: PHB depolymerase family esterase [Sphingomicrobium sp.]|nr:PHB depolymerase family esterase [Sphingomicrobium sp.]